MGRGNGTDSGRGAEAEKEGVGKTPTPSFSRAWRSMGRGHKMERKIQIECRIHRAGMGAPPTIMPTVPCPSPPLFPRWRRSAQVGARDLGRGSGTDSGRGAKGATGRVGKTPTLPVARDWQSVGRGHGEERQIVPNRRIHRGGMKGTPTLVPTVPCPSVPWSRGSCHGNLRKLRQRRPDAALRDEDLSPDGRTQSGERKRTGLGERKSCPNSGVRSASSNFLRAACGLSGRRQVRTRAL